MLIGADGGANVLFDMGIPFDLAIGDLDSIRHEVRSAVRSIQDQDQETNDLEKCLNFCLEHGLKRVQIAGAMGERLDHELKNLSVLLQFHPHFDFLQIQDEVFSVMVAKAEEQFRTTPGKTFSLFPLSGRVEGIFTEGLKYPLVDGILQNGMRDGSSNEASSSMVSVTHRSGDLLIIYER